MDSCKSRENCVRRWLVMRGEILQVSETEALPVVTSSSPFSPDRGIGGGTCGVEKYIVLPLVPRRAQPCREEVPRAERSIQLQKPGIAQQFRPETPCPWLKAGQQRRIPAPCRSPRNRRDEAAPRPSAEPEPNCRPENDLLWAHERCADRGH
jgi:hypothetical protein